MKAYFRFTRTISQGKEKEIIETVVYGRALEKIKVGDEFQASMGVYNYSWIISDIEAYGKTLNEVDAGITCILTIRGKDYLDNAIEFMGK